MTYVDVAENLMRLGFASPPEGTYSDEAKLTFLRASLTAEGEAWFYARLYDTVFGLCLPNEMTAKGLAEAIAAYLNVTVPNALTFTEYEVANLCVVRHPWFVQYLIDWALASCEAD